MVLSIVSIPDVLVASFLVQPVSIENIASNIMTVLFIINAKIIVLDDQAVKNKKSCTVMQLLFSILIFKTQLRKGLRY